MDKYTDKEHDEARSEQPLLLLVSSFSFLSSLFVSFFCFSLADPGLG